MSSLDESGIYRLNCLLIHNRSIAKMIQHQHTACSRYASCN